MAILGAIYALGFLAVLGVSALVDGGGFARLYLVGGTITPEMVQSPEFPMAMWVGRGVYRPFSVLFVYAPARVAGQGGPPREGRPVAGGAGGGAGGAAPGDGGKANRIRAQVSSWRRISPESLIPSAKASGQYLNSVLAKIESQKAGYEEAILLDDHGYVCEGTGENVYVVRDGVIATPGQSNSILDGITPRSLLHTAPTPGYTPAPRHLPPSRR